MRAPDGTASPTSSEGGREGSRVASPQGVPACLGDRTLSLRKSVPALLSHPREWPVEANRFRSTVAPGQSHPLMRRSVRLLLRVSG